jgi:hypothetical protein
MSEYLFESGKKFFSDYFNLYDVSNEIIEENDESDLEY